MIPAYITRAWRNWIAQGTSISKVAGSNPAARAILPTEIIEVRTREYLARMAFDRAKARHHRSANLRRKWIKAKAALVAVEGRYMSKGERQ